MLRLVLLAFSRKSVLLRRKAWKMLIKEYSINKRSLCSIGAWSIYVYRRRGFFCAWWLWYSCMWQLLFIQIHFLALFQKKEEKNSASFLFTSSFVAININDSGLCDDEIPPSSLRAGVTYLPMSLRLCAALFETDSCRHPWRFTPLLQLKEQSTDRRQQL